MNRENNLDTHCYLSLGVGTQSSLLAIMIANKDPRVKEYWDAKIIFSDTGAEEWHTYSYLHLVLKPYLKEKGKEIIIIQTDHFLADEFESKYKVPMGWANPSCSSFSKRDNIRKYYRKQHGTNGRISAKKTRIIELIGISMDEGLRAKDSNVSWLERRYPLLEMKIYRSELKTYYDEYGVEMPKKSGCWFCPNKGRDHFIQLKQNEPDRFAQLVKWEEYASKNRGNQVTFIYKFPLVNLNDQTSLDDFDWSDQMCDSGFCLT